MILRPNLIRMVMGFGLYSNAANLLMIACGGYASDKLPPFLVDGVAASRMMDPLPPDIILTAIVISFATGALLLIVSYRVYLGPRYRRPAEAAESRRRGVTRSMTPEHHHHESAPEALKPETRDPSSP